MSKKSTSSVTSGSSYKTVRSIAASATNFGKSVRRSSRIRSKDVTPAPEQLLGQSPSNTAAEEDEVRYPEGLERLEERGHIRMAQQPINGQPVHLRQAESRHQDDEHSFLALLDVEGLYDAPTNKPERLESQFGTYYNPVYDPRREKAKIFGIGEHSSAWSHHGNSEVAQSDLPLQFDPLAQVADLHHNPSIMGEYNPRIHHQTPNTVTAYPRILDISMLEPFQAASPSSIPATQEGSLVPSHSKRSTISRIVRRVRTCHIFILLAFFAIAGSLAPAIWRLVDRDDWSDGFSMAQYILEVGVFVVGCMAAIHSKTCTCWKKQKGIVSDHEMHAI